MFITFVTLAFIIRFLSSMFTTFIILVHNVTIFYRFLHFLIEPLTFSIVTDIKENMLN